MSTEELDKLSDEEFLSRVRVGIEKNMDDLSLFLYECEERGDKFIVQIFGCAKENKFYYTRRVNL